MPWTIDRVLLSLEEPTEATVRAFLARQEKEPFSYPEVGASDGGAPPGYDLDHNRVCLGKGRAVFAAAAAAIARWRMFPPRWTRIEPAGAPIREGTVVGLVIHVFGLWWLSAARIVYVLDQSEPVRRFGFAYGTLTGHVERGEERFSVEWLPDDTVWYDLRAFSQPRHRLVRLAYPLARKLQRRFVLGSQAAMRQAVAGVPGAAP